MAEQERDEQGRFAGGGGKEEAIPPPKDPEQRKRWERQQQILNSDPRTAGSGTPRPKWLVERVLRDAEHGVNYSKWAKTKLDPSRLKQAFADAAALDALTGKRS